MAEMLIFRPSQLEKNFIVTQYLLFFIVANAAQV